jgi:hypothetical protein
MNTKGQAHAYTLAKLFEVKDTGVKGKGLCLQRSPFSREL